MKKVLCFMMVVLLFAAFAGCSGQEQKTDLTGTYTISSLESKGRTYQSDHLEKAGFGSYAGFTLELRADGTGTMTKNGESVEITCQDGAITLQNDSGQTILFGTEGETLTLRMGNITLNLEKIQ